jgi:predicted Zn-dependent peptidase
MRRGIAIAIFGLLLALGGGARGEAAPFAIAAPVQTTFDGATIVQQPDTQSSLIGLQLFVAAGLDRQTPAQNGLSALVAEDVLNTPVGDDHVPLHDALQREGGSVAYSVDGNWIRYYVEGLKANFAPRILPLFEAALSHPLFDAQALLSARAELNRKIAQDQLVPLTVGLEMLNAAFFTDSDAGLPQYGLPAILAGLGPQDAQRFFSTYYHRSGAIVSAAGGLDALRSDDFAKLADTLPAGQTRPISVRLGKLRGAQRRLVARRDIAVPWLVAQFPAPSLRSSDFGAMLVLTSFLERTASEVAENPSVTTRTLSDRAAGALYNFDERPANVVLFINGGFGDPSRPFTTALSVIQIFARSKLSGDVGSMKTIAAGTYLDAATSLEDRTWLAGVFASQNVSPDFVRRGLDAIARVRAADLQRVARSYLSNPNVAIVLPRDLQSTSS